MLGPKYPGSSEPVYWLWKISVFTQATLGGQLRSLRLSCQRNNLWVLVGEPVLEVS